MTTPHCACFSLETSVLMVDPLVVDGISRLTARNVQNQQPSMEFYMFHRVV